MLDSRFGFKYILNCCGRGVAVTSALAIGLPFWPSPVSAIESIGSGSCAQQVANGIDVTVSEFVEDGKSYCAIEFRAVGENIWMPPEWVKRVEYLVVAGGGGGGMAWNVASAGGGGAGGLLQGDICVSSAELIPVSVGAGGTAGSVTLSSDNQNVLASVESGNGENSAFSTLTAVGGGGGGNARGLGLSGGSGGGSGGRTASGAVGTVRDGGAGTEGQGFRGGASVGQTALGSGGGGASEPGQDSTSTGAGGAGLNSTISGSAVTYATGGDGGFNGEGIGTSGIANTGNGGAAGSTALSGTVSGGDGGSGIVIARYIDDRSFQAGECEFSVGGPSLEHYLERAEQVSDLPNTR